MATIIHIQETTSDQVTEIIAETTREAIHAYVRNANGKRWDRLHGVRYFPGTDIIKRMTYEFDNGERALIRFDRPGRYLVAWQSTDGAY